jgi:hypothetical protein
MGNVCVFSLLSSGFFVSSEFVRQQEPKLFQLNEGVGYARLENISLHPYGGNNIETKKETWKRAILENTTKPN